jgi:hypothetical protein
MVIKIDGKLAIYDLNQQKEIVPTRYELMRPFREQMAAVKTQTAAGGYIDITGKEVIPPVYDDADEFRNGVAWVIKKWQKNLYQ